MNLISQSQVSRFLIAVSLVAAMIMIGAGCKKAETPSAPEVNTQIQSCIGCHSDQETLKKIAAPNPPPPAGEGGCGGTLPEMEAWQKVYIGGPNGEAFLKSPHGKLKCTDCHRGVEPATDKTKAHAGDFVAAPSRDAVTYCGSCHAAIAKNNATSIHTQGFGQKAMVCVRSGYSSYENYPNDLKMGYDANCGKCHSSCGECHVMRPKQAGGGFLAAHSFQKAPDMRLNCTACHSARVAHAYFGEAFGSKPDVHYFKFPGGNCTNCHKADEMHGDGTVYTQRYSVAKQPKCEGCHADKATANVYHTKHWNDISCQTCHSQDYQNCGSCHVGTGVRNGPYMGFKIARNPLPTVKRFKFVVVRNAPHAPDTWSNYGIPALANFAAAPTFKLATPHNIQRWTARTTVDQGKTCFDACHISSGRNKQYFLFQSDLQSWEVEANKNIVVDGNLPAGWN